MVDAKGAALSAVLTFLVIGSVTFGMPTLASAQTERERVLVVTEEGRTGNIERVINVRPGQSWPAILADCDDKHVRSEGDGDSRVHIVFCGKDGQRLTAEERAARIAEVRTRVRSYRGLPPEERSRVGEMLREIPRGPAMSAEERERLARRLEEVAARLRTR